MTEVRDDAVISEALSVIDKALAEMLNRDLVSTDEVADLLLDVRWLLDGHAGDRPGADAHRPVLGVRVSRAVGARRTLLSMHAGAAPGSATAAVSTLRPMSRLPS